jgi:hypothetical protein
LSKRILWRWTQLHRYVSCLSIAHFVWSSGCDVLILCQPRVHPQGSIIGGRTFRKPPYFVLSKPQTAFVFS